MRQRMQDQRQSRRRGRKRRTVSLPTDVRMAGSSPKLSFARTPKALSELCLRKPGEETLDGTQPCYIDLLPGLTTWTYYLDSLPGLTTWTYYLDLLLRLTTQTY